MHLQRNLAADLQRGLQKQVERARHRALGRILDRHHTILDGAGLDRAEHLVNARARHAADLVAEVRVERLLGKGADRPQEGNLQRLLRAAACRHHFAPDRRHAFTQQRSGIGCTLRITCSSRSGRNTGAPYFFFTSPTSSAAGAAVEHGEQFAIHGIDLLAQRREFDRQACSAALGWLPAGCVSSAASCLSWLVMCGICWPAPAGGTEKPRGPAACRGHPPAAQQHSGRAALEFAHEVDERHHALERHRVVDTRPHAAHGLVALELHQPGGARWPEGFVAGFVGGKNGTFMRERQLGSISLR